MQAGYPWRQALRRKWFCERKFKEVENIYPPPSILVPTPATLTTDVRSWYFAPIVFALLV
jgi:hypothetical protein